MFLLKFKPLLKNFIWPKDVGPSLSLPGSSLQEKEQHHKTDCVHTACDCHPSSTKPPENIQRRQFLTQAACISTLFLTLPSWAKAEQDQFWLNPRRLRLYRPQLNKTIDVVYWQNGALDWAGYKEICYLFQDHRQQAAATIDIKLLDLLCAMQAWTTYYGFDRPIQLNSDYRTQQTNRILEGAARNSMHLQGRAADVVFPELPVSYVGKLAQHYSGGGVGFYPQSNFVHIDTGRVRTWGRRA